MNFLKKISTNNKGNFPSIVILCYIFIALLGLIFGSQELSSTVDLENIYLAPFQNSNYILGTDGLGRSVAFGLINGIKISLYIAFCTGLFSLILAMFFSYLAGYLGDDKLFMSLPIIIAWVLITLICMFYMWYSPSVLTFIIWPLISFVMIKIDRAFFSSFKKSSLPIDTIIMKIIELIQSMPGIFLILFIFALFSERSINIVIALITFARTPSIIRLARSEILKVKSQEYIQAAEAVGIKSFKIFINHIFPNILTPIKTYFVYTIAVTILIESTLSFLGLGLPLETVSLGSMLSSSRDFFGAWWLAIFPGGIIFLLIYSLRKFISHKVESTDYLYL